MAGSSKTPQFWLAQMALLAAVIGLVFARFVRSPDPGNAILIAEGVLWALFGVFTARHKLREWRSRRPRIAGRARSRAFPL
jgi:hypothetical protein